VEPDLIEALRRVTDNFVEQSRAVDQHTDIFDLEPTHSREQPQVRRLKQPDQHHSVYDTTLRHPKILDAVEDLIGPGVRYQSTKLNLKAAGVGSPVEWHQDWAFYPHTNDRVLAVGLAIDDMTLDNGCLMVIPGSHTGPILDHHFNGVFAGAVAHEEIAGQQQVPLILKAGDISIHHARLLHGSAPNRSGNPRRFFLKEFCALNAWPLCGLGGDGDFTWAHYVSHILRGEPVLTPRLEPVPVRVPYPKSDRQGSIYENQSILRGTVAAEWLK
jgi:ectoine hydroxylase-related dioxygenase (phytanoyl-CoA dioxygenase family)